MTFWGFWKVNSDTLIKPTVHVSYCNRTLILAGLKCLAYQIYQLSAHTSGFLYYVAWGQFEKPASKGQRTFKYLDVERPEASCLHQYVTIMNSHDRVLPNSRHWTVGEHRESNENVQFKKENLKKIIFSPHLFIITTWLTPTLNEFLRMKL